MSEVFKKKRRKVETYGRDGREARKNYKINGILILKFSALSEILKNMELVIVTISISNLLNYHLSTDNPTASQIGSFPDRCSSSTAVSQAITPTSCHCYGCSQTAVLLIRSEIIQEILLLLECFIKKYI